jgi:DNA repair protein RecO (recombination protein O)
MRWQDQGIILGTKRHGEKSFVVSLLTEQHGRYKGLFQGSQKSLFQTQPGNYVRASWQARLSEHLGRLQLEPIESPAAFILSKPLALIALSSACALSNFLLPEREPQPVLFQSFLDLLHAFKQESWLKAYILFELRLLEVTGIKIDLERCVVTGSKENLAYVSPRTGKAVVKAVGEPYEQKLLPLPSFLSVPSFQGITGTDEVLKAFNLTEYFFERYVLQIHGVKMPSSRMRLKEKIKTKVKEWIP